jgi:hypothetical protein
MKKQQADAMPCTAFFYGTDAALHNGHGQEIEKA